MEASRRIGQRQRHHAVESARAGERRVEGGEPVGRADDEDLVRRAEAVHQREQLVERVVVLLVAAGALVAPRAERIDLVDEENARRQARRRLEDAAHAPRAAPDEDLDELGTRAREEGHTRRAGHCLGEERLARARWACEQDAARPARAEPRPALGAVEEVDHLLQLRLGRRHAAHVLEGDARRVVCRRGSVRQLDLAASEVRGEAEEEPAAHAEVGEREQQHHRRLPRGRPERAELHPVRVHQLDERARLARQQLRAVDLAVVEAVGARARGDAHRAHQPALHLPHQRRHRHLQPERSPLLPSRVYRCGDKPGTDRERCTQRLAAGLIDQLLSLASEPVDDVVQHWHL
mmetsp:Transcript_24174/g.71981  ORF Transcript_24174/g.71981 Transcript_24174/m.71981 type:complete len:349 (+) Transcript_24174:893-1939(+)